MGFRFRKSINLGGGLRINLSKTGVGYSWGTKGYRVTKKAGGGGRTTASIPGTGISYTNEFRGKYENGGERSSNASKNQRDATTINNHYNTQEIKNADAKTLVSEGLEDMLTAANKALLLHRINTIVFWVSLVLGIAYFVPLLLTVACIVFRIYLEKKAVIDLEYSFEDEQADEIARRMAPLIKIANSNKIWWVSQTSEVVDKKYTAGASSSVKRQDCKASTKVPFPFKSNATAVLFKSGKEAVMFMPDKLFVIQGIKVGALNYSDVTTSVHGQRFVENETVPRDAQIVGHTWKYVNKSGGPDKRFQDNKELPICLYGEMEIRSKYGVNTDIIFSNPDIE